MSTHSAKAKAAKSAGQKAGKGQGFDVSPAADAFQKRYKSGRPQVVWTRLVADLETPVSVYLKLAQGKPMSFLLESVEGGAARGRYSVIGLEPDIVWRANGDVAEINRTPIAKPEAFKTETKPTHSRRCGHCWKSRVSICPKSCRRWRRVCSGIWAMTRCA